MAYATLDQVSHVLSLSPRRINQLVKDEGMPRISRGEYDLVKVVQWYIAHLRGQLEEARHGLESEAQARRRLLTTTADIRAIDLADRRGEIITIEDAILILSDIFVVMRTRIMNIPRRAEMLIGGKNDHAEVRNILDEYVRDVLTDLSTLPDQMRSLPKRSKKVRQDGDALLDEALNPGKKTKARKSATKDKKAQQDTKQGKSVSDQATTKGSKGSDEPAHEA